MRSPRNGAGLHAGVWVLALGGLLGLSACPSSDPCQDNPDDPSCPNRCIEDPSGPTCPPLGPGAPAQAKAIGTADRPLCAVVDPDGQTVYLAAYDEVGQAQVYSMPVSGGAPALIDTGRVLSHPVGMTILPSGGALLIADLGDPGGTGGETGAIYRVTISGGAKALTMGELRQPSGVAISNDGKDVYVTGADKDDGQPGVWRFAEAGGVPALFYKGDKLSNPSGIVMAGDGAIYVADPTALGPRAGAVLKIDDGGATVVSQAPLVLGFPAGLSSAGVGHADVLLTALRQKDGLGVVYRLTAAGELSEVAVGVTPNDPGTLHRAARANVWVAVDAVSLPISIDPAKALGQLWQLVP